MTGKTRRSVLASIAASAGVVTAGCTDVFGGGEPDPFVSAPQGPADLYPVEGGRPVVLGSVRNRGASGSVRVTVTFYGQGGGEISKRSKTIHVGSDEPVQVEFEPPFPDLARTFTMEAEPA